MGKMSNIEKEEIRIKNPRKITESRLGVMAAVIIMLTLAVGIFVCGNIDGYAYNNTNTYAEIIENNNTPEEDAVVYEYEDAVLYDKAIIEILPAIIDFTVPTKPPTTEPEPEPTVETTTEPPTTVAPTTTQPQTTTAPPPTTTDNRKMIAFTFDDGPSKYTEEILDTLTENDCKATFCVVGYKINSYKETIKNTVKQGSQVIGHSWNHPQLTKLSADRIKSELQDTNEAIFNVTGIRPVMYRPPYRSFNDTVKKVSKELGLAIIHWNVDPSDWKVRNADSVYNNIMSHVKEGCIIGCHDVYASTAAAMKRVVPDLIAKGYKLVTVEELLGETKPGEVYYYKK